MCNRLFKIFHATQQLMGSTHNIGKLVEGHGTIWVANRTETECFAVVRDCIFKIFHLFMAVRQLRLLTASKNCTSKVAEGHETIWVANRTETECFASVRD